jgi:hypothetical protein
MFKTPLHARTYYSYQPLWNLSLCHLHNSKCYTSTFYLKSNRPLHFPLASWTALQERLDSGHPEKETEILREGKKDKDGEDKTWKKRVPSPVVVMEPVAFAPTRFLYFKFFFSLPRVSDLSLWRVSPLQLFFSSDESNVQKMSGNAVRSTT